MAPTPVHRRDRRRLPQPQPQPQGGRPQLAVLLLAWLAAAATIVLVLSGCRGGHDDGPTPTTLTLLAGPAETGGQAQRDGTGQQARLSMPSAIAATADGGAWLIDHDGQRLRRASATGELHTAFDLDQLPAVRDDAGNTQWLLAARHLAVAPDGALYLSLLRVTVAPGVAVADAAIRPIDRLTPDTVLDSRWAVVRLDAAGAARVVASDPHPEPRPGDLTSRAQLNGLAFDPQGRLHLADGGSCTVWQLAADGRLVAVHQAPAAHQPQQCRHLGGLASRITRLAFDRAGTMWLGRNDGSLWRVPASGAAQQVGQAQWANDGCGGLVALGDGRLVLAHGRRPDELAQWQPGVGVQPWLGAEADGRWVDGGPAVARFRHVCALAPSPDGGVWAVDTLNHAVRHVDPQGRVSTWLGLPDQWGWRDGPGAAARFEAGFGLAADGDRLWVADAGNQVLRQVDADGRVRTVSGQPVRGTTTAQALDGPAAQVRWASPQAVTPGAGGRLWVGDTYAVRLQQANGDVHTVADAGPGRVKALAALPGGDVAVLASDYRWGPAVTGRSVTLLLQVSADGQRRHLLPPDTPLLLQAAAAGIVSEGGLCRTPDGSLFFSLGHAVLRRSPAGDLAVAAGHLTAYGAVDGLAEQARFNSPRGLACDDAGRVYVADADNHAVRRIGPGEVHTVLGQRGVPGLVQGSAPGGLDRPTHVVLVPGGLVVAQGRGLVKAHW